MQNYKDAMEIIRGSKQFSFSGTVLEITGYYTGKSIKLDLGALTEEMLEELTPEPEEYEEDEWV